MPVHTSPKQHYPRSYKRRANFAKSPRVIAQKPQAQRSPDLGYSAPWSSAKAAAAAAETAPSTLSKPSSASTQVDFQQFAFVHTRDPLLSSQRLEQIVTAPKSS